jgi:hypothetical protein
MFKISFDQADYQRIIFATHKEEAMAELQVNDMQYYCSVDFLMLIRRNIMGQKHMGDYAPLNPRYKAWKQQYGRSGLNFWALFGDLLKSLKVYREGIRTKRTSSWFAGVPIGAKDSGGKSWFGRGDRGKRKSIEQIGNWMEYGRRGQPARSLFGGSILRKDALELELMSKEKGISIEGVFPADIVIRLLISAKSLNKLLDYISKARMEYDGVEEPNLKEADRFVKEEFFPLLDSLSEEIKRGIYGS